MKSSTRPLALLSVTDKDGIVEFARGLAGIGFGLLSTGGTARVLRESGLEVQDVAAFAGSPEIFDGRVKTLHPKVHGGILMDRDNPGHRQQAEEHGIAPIDLVVVNLYQFEKNAQDQGLDLAQAIEFIDIGGPTMLRAAAKNYRHTAPVIDPADYGTILQELQQGSLTDATRTMLAAKTFRTISSYDHMIAAYFEKALDQSGEAREIRLERIQGLRYGENPHQDATFYRVAGESTSGFQDARVLQGKELSYNNLVDVDAATAIVADLAALPAVAIIKHTNPCGVAAGAGGESIRQIYERALEGDPKSAFGGIVAVNRELDGDTAALMSEIFLECIAAPSFSREAKEVFAAKKNLRILEVPFLQATAPVATGGVQIKSIRGGMLVQALDELVAEAGKWEFATQSKPDDKESQDLAFAMVVAKHVKSNAIVYVRDLQTIAVGAGQMSRIDSANFAFIKAEEQGKSLRGTVMASDAFFPFRDSVDLAAKHGVRAIVQPGGSIRDKESIEACDEAGIAMVFTGKRHFKH